MKWVDQAFPANGLVYPKCEEKLPFMTWAEIKRRIRAGADADSLWACLYLDTEEVTALLAYVKAQKAPDWMFPMLATAAYTGARRSELIRALQEDIDIRGNVVTIREKKRARGSRTTRRVPMCSPLAKTLKEWLARRRGCRNLFGPGDRVARMPVFVLAPFADASLHLAFDVLHRRIDRFAERIDEPLVFGGGVQRAHALGDMKIQIVADRAVVLSPLKQLVASLGMELIAKGVPIGPFDFAR